jgi:hypothetical protein
VGICNKNGQVATKMKISTFCYNLNEHDWSVYEPSQVM